MLPKVTVLKNYCLSTKLHFVCYSYLCLSYSDCLLASHSNDFILYCTYLSIERFLENEGFFQGVRVSEFALI